MAAGSHGVGAHRPSLSPEDTVSIEMRRPISFFERHFEMPDILLARYEVAR